VGVKKLGKFDNSILHRYFSTPLVLN